MEAVDVVEGRCLHAHAVFSVSMSGRCPTVDMAPIVASQMQNNRARFLPPFLA